MAVYLDTSLLVPLFFHETASAMVRLRMREERELWVSRWAVAEFSSAAAFKVRTGQSDEGTASAALDRLRAALSAGHFLCANVEDGDVDRAGQLCEAHASGLRTPDALHAAIATRLRTALLTRDKGQAEGCRFHGVRHEYIGR